ncbi:ribonucleoside-diphosphate reductase subunit alpha [bacterium]|nr:ribonucleoside-diphosphate reductase subunit alpha [bacterium]
MRAIESVTGRNGEKLPYDGERLRQLIYEACEGFEDTVSSELIFSETQRNLYNGIKESELMQAAIFAARPLLEREPNYSYVAARLLLQTLFEETIGRTLIKADRKKAYSEYFPRYLVNGIEAERVNPRLRSDFDLTRIVEAFKPERDELFGYIGLQTLYDRYFIHIDKKRIELPQIFWMRVAMGLALVEKTMEDRTEKAIEFYNILSNFDYVSSTPTLFNSGTNHSQLSSCFLTYVPDDLRGIYDGVRDNAMLSKFSGGLGNDWSSVRGLGAYIKGTNGQSQGVIPFLKVANDTAIAVNQGGKRKGAVCSYLETWHIDVEEYLELRKNTGDDRRRCHDMNTANWIPDLFMKRVEANGSWTLFSPEEVPDLHETYGSDFERRYNEYEAKTERGEIRNFKKVEAVKLWRKMLSMVFETGHPWLTFKDPCNVRSPQQHVGVVHSSNLCTEITLNTSVDEIAVCNLGSINLKNHMLPGDQGINKEKLAKTARTALRMLDNVIDQNLYPVPQAKNSNLKHRPVGMGLMGFQDALYMMRIPYDTVQAADFADEVMENISYNAILASTELAKERGTYSSYKGSLWDKGILPFDSVDMLEKERGKELNVSRQSKLDWTPVREAVKKYGMRNSNCMAIAPTATIANISGVTQSIEPTYKNLYVKSNMSGEFIFINPFLVKDLKKLGLWDNQMISDLKQYDGDVNMIARVPENIRILYKTAFQIEPSALIDAAARRQKWIDQAQSLNLYLEKPSGKKIDEMYRYAWNTGLKTTYYLRSMGASSIEKSTITTRGEHTNVAPMAPATAEARSSYEPQMCSIENPECEACQ